MKLKFEEFIEQNLGRIRYIAKRYANNPDTEDLFQEILLQLWRSYDSFDKKSKPETWLYRVALNTAITSVRKSVKHKEVLSKLGSFFKEETQPNQEHSESQILDTFMDTLTETDANILMMYLDGLSAPEMATVIGISSNAVSARISRIKKAFEENYVGDE